MQLCTINSINLAKDWFLYVSSSHNAAKSMAFVFGGVQKHIDSTHLSAHSSKSSRALQNLIVCLFMQAIVPSDVTEYFCSNTLEFSHSWCVYTVHNTLTVYDLGHEVCVGHSLICYTSMSPEWKTVRHSTSSGPKMFHSSPVVWGPL